MGEAVLFRLVKGKKAYLLDYATTEDLALVNGTSEGVVEKDPWDE